MWTRRFPTLSRATRNFSATWRNMDSDWFGEWTPKDPTIRTQVDPAASMSFGIQHFTLPVLKVIVDGSWIHNSWATSRYSCGVWGWQDPVSAPRLRPVAMTNGGDRHHSQLLRSWPLQRSERRLIVKRTTSIFHFFLGTTMHYRSLLVWRPVWLANWLTVYINIYVYINLPINLSIYLSIYVNIYIYIYLHTIDHDCTSPDPTPTRSIPLGLRSRQWSKIGTAGETWLLMMSLVFNISCIPSM